MQFSTSIVGFFSFCFAQNLIIEPFSSFYATFVFDSRVSSCCYPQPALCVAVRVPGVAAGGGGGGGGAAAAAEPEQHGRGGLGGGGPAAGAARPHPPQDDGLPLQQVREKSDCRLKRNLFDKTTLAKTWCQNNLNDSNHEF